MTNRPKTSIPPAAEDEIDFAALFRKLWAHKWTVISATMLGAVASVLLALSLPNIYRAEAVVVPSHDDGNSSLSALAAQYGGLASLAGINLRSDAVDKTELGLKILKSRKFVADFVERHELLVPLIAADGWSLESGELEIEPDIYDSRAQKWIREARPPRGPVPSRQEAYEKFLNDVLSVNRDNKTGFITIAVEHYSPLLAKQWVDWLIADINNTVMQQEVEEAQQAIDYLESQVAATPLADLQEVFFRLIEDQTKTVMLAKVSPEYLFRTIDPAVVPELKARPRRALIAILGTALGGLFGVVLALVSGHVVAGRGRAS